LYARFFTKVLFDAGFIDFDEPFLKVRHQGLIQGEDGRRMSKRWGNVVNPDDICAKFGADTLRVYEMFMGPFKEGLPWSTRTIKGVKRFMERIWKMQDLVDLEGEPNNPKIKAELHKLIKKVGEDIEDMSFNTAVAEYMKFVNTVYDEAKNQEKCLSKSEFMDFLKILSPFAPFITEELWTSLNQFDQSKPEEIYTKSIHTSPWPKFDENLIQSEAITIGIQINGKRRAEVTLSPTATQAEAEKIVLSLPEVQKWTNGQTPKKFIYVPGKIVNLVI
jgi:leucyl-tRNA synthetase